MITGKTNCHARFLIPISGSAAHAFCLFNGRLGKRITDQTSFPSFTYAAGNTDKGKVLSESSTPGGGTTGKCCITCHQGGKGLGNDLIKRKHFSIRGIDIKDLADVVNVCIEKPLGGGGAGLDPQGEEMKNLLAYIKALVDPSARK